MTSPPRPSGGQGSARLAALLDESMAALVERNSQHRALWGLGDEERWDLDQDSGDLVFTFADGRTVRAAAQIIGTYDSAQASWMWAWRNPSIDARMTRAALQVKRFGERKGIGRLTDPKWRGDEDDAWAMTAIALWLCEANGAYRGPAGSTYVFMTFEDVEEIPPGSSEGSD